MPCVVPPFYASCDTGPWNPQDCGYLTTCCVTCTPPCTPGTVGTICPGNVAPAGWEVCDRQLGTIVKTTYCNIAGYLDGDVQSRCAGWRSCRGLASHGNNGGCVCGAGYCSSTAVGQCPGRCPICPTGWTYSSSTGCCENSGACMPTPIPVCPNKDCWWNTFTCAWVCTIGPACNPGEVMEPGTCLCSCPETAKPACLQVAPYCDWVRESCGWACIGNDPPPCAAALNCRFVQNSATLACEWVCDTPSCPVGQTWDPDACRCTVNDCPAPPGNCYCALTGACGPCTYPPCYGFVAWVWNEARCVWEIDGLPPSCPSGQEWNWTTCACADAPGVGDGTACVQPGGSGTATACSTAGGTGFRLT